MAAVLDFASPFYPATGYYSGTGSTALVPDVYPIAINGRPYMIDTRAGTYQRRYDARVRDSVDQSTEPGEAALNPQGLWRRTQSSWHYGAGQGYADATDSEPYRFNTSKGVDPWSKGTLKLQRATDQVVQSANTNLYLATADSRLYMTDGQTLKYSTDLSTFSAVTGTNASNIYSIASDGYNVFVSYDDGDIDQTTAIATSASNYITGIEAGKLDYVKGRLMVAGQGSDKYKIWNITTTPGSSANNPSALFSHPNTNFTWVGFAAGQNYIYCGGHAGNKTIIYKTQIKADGTALDIPTVAGELPFGEIIVDIHGYLGYVIIGLEDGFRFCSSDDDGNLVIGPKVTTGCQVEEFAGVGQYIYFGWKNFDSTSTGIGRMDISVFISTNQPAYASDLMVDGQGSILDVHEYDNKPIFTVSGLGLYKQHATNYVSSGYIETGIYRWGIADAKFIPKYDIRTLPLDGSVTLSIKSDGGSYEDFNPFNTADATNITIDGFQDRIYEAEFKVTLAKGATTTGPTITRFMARAYAAPLRSQIFTVPIIMHHSLSINGREYWQDVDYELTQLRDLVDNPRVVTYQENEETFSVVVEDVVMETRQIVYRHNANDHEGTATVIMRSVR